MLQVLLPDPEGDADRVDAALGEFAGTIGPYAGPRLVVDGNPAEAIVRAAGGERRRARRRQRRHERPQGVPARQRSEPRLAQRPLHGRDRQHGRTSRAAAASGGDVSEAPTAGRGRRRTAARARGADRPRAGRHGLPAATGETPTTRDRARRLRGGARGARPDLRQARPDDLDAAGSRPARVRRGLSTLQDRVPPLTEAEVVSVMEEELGVPWEDVFESIEPEPLAAGTIGQVHRATLEDGERVVVKVQRPNAREEILRDLGCSSSSPRRPPSARRCARSSTSRP